MNGQEEKRVYSPLDPPDKRERRVVPAAVCVLLGALCLCFVVFSVVLWGQNARMRTEMDELRAGNATLSAELEREKDQVSELKEARDELAAQNRISGMTYEERLEAAKQMDQARNAGRFTVTPSTPPTVSVDVIYELTFYKALEEALGRMENDLSLLVDGEWDSLRNNFIPSGPGAGKSLADSMIERLQSDSDSLEGLYQVVPFASKVTRLMDDYRDSLSYTVNALSRNSPPDMHHTAQQGLTCMTTRKQVNTLIWELLQEAME